MADSSDRGKRRGSESGERRESRGESSSSQRRQSASGSSQGGPSSDPRDLKQREYRDENGQIHHHTRTSQAMKEKKAA